jgi:hypothetical protein
MITHGQTFVGSVVLDADVDALDGDLEVLEDVRHQLLHKGVATTRLLLTCVYIK